MFERLNLLRLVFRQKRTITARETSKAIAQVLVFVRTLAFGEGGRCQSSSVHPRARAGGPCGGCLLLFFLNLRH